jgi:DNA cross-link repair 1A protein
VSQLDRGEFVEVEVGKTLVVDDPAGVFSVTAFDANHCPGKFRFRLLCSGYVLYSLS